MAYDEELADRVLEHFAVRHDLTRRKMFGGLCVMLGGHMACGVIGERLMLRLGAEGAARALAEAHVREMDFTGKPMAGMVYVDAPGCARTSSSAPGSTALPASWRRCRRSGRAEASLARASRYSTQPFVAGAQKWLVTRTSWIRQTPSAPFRKSSSYQAAPHIAVSTPAASRIVQGM